MKEVNGLKLYTLSEVEDRIIGKKGTPKRDKYEYDLRMDILGELIREARKKQNLTQQDLGQLIGVQKATISKLERHAKNITMDTILRVFNALKAKVSLKIEFDNKTNLEIAG